MTGEGEACAGGQDPKRVAPASLTAAPLKVTGPNDVWDEHGSGARRPRLLERCFSS